jgi:hypothetical protein
MTFSLPITGFIIPKLSHLYSLPLAGLQRHKHERYNISPLYYDIINRFIDICLVPAVSLQQQQ